MVNGSEIEIYGGGWIGVRISTRSRNSLDSRKREKRNEKRGASETNKAGFKKESGFFKEKENDDSGAKISFYSLMR